MKPTLWILSAVLLAPRALPAEEYTLGPDSQRHDSVPKGTVTKHSWTSKIFPGTVRDYWIYVPAQYRAGRPAPFMVFQDGAGFVTDSGAWRAPIVFDNLIHKREMPPTIGIFISPGRSCKQRTNCLNYHLPSGRTAMKIATYNVNSIRRRLQLVLDWASAHKPDVICLQETKVQRSGFPRRCFS